MGIAESKQISKREVEVIEKFGNHLFEFSKAINKLSIISLKDISNSYKFSRFVRGLIFFGLKTKQDKDLLRKLIYQNKIPFLSARADIISSLKLTELQIAGGLWSTQSRLAFSQNIYGYELLNNYYINLKQILKFRNNPTICFLVHNGINHYFDEFADFAQILNQNFKRKIAYVVGNGGLKVKNDGVYYLNQRGKLIKIDVIYSIGDIRRFFIENMQDILQAVVDKKVILEPTLNPLLNNFQLALSLLNDNLTRDWLEYELNPKTISYLKKYTVQYYLASEDNIMPIKINAHTLELPFKEVVKFLTRKRRKQLLIRDVLTNNFKKLSGGKALNRLHKINKKRVDSKIYESFLASSYLKNTGEILNNKEIVTLSYYFPSYLDDDINIWKKENNKIKKYKLDKPRMLNLAFYLFDGKKVRLVGLHRAYSDRNEGSFRIGGSKKSVGALTKN